MSMMHAYRLAHFDNVITFQLRVAASSIFPFPVSLAHHTVTYWAISTLYYFGG
jgi:hypothetical protein